MEEDHLQRGQPSLPSSEPLLENLRLAAEAAHDKYIKLLQVHRHAVDVYEESMKAPAWNYEVARRSLRATQIAAIDASNSYERERSIYENIANLLKGSD